MSDSSKQTTKERHLGGTKLISNTSLFWNGHSPLSALGWTQRRQDWPSCIIPMWKFARLSKNVKLLARNSFHVHRCLKSGDHQWAASAECEADQDKPPGLSRNTIPKMDLRHRPDGFDLLLPWLCGEPVWYFLWEPPVVVFGFKKQSLPTGICFLQLLPEFNPEKSRVCRRGAEFPRTSCREWWKLVSITDITWFHHFGFNTSRKHVFSPTKLRMAGSVSIYTFISVGSLVLCIQSASREIHREFASEAQLLGKSDHPFPVAQR